jgi:hypothetical protein
VVTISSKWRAASTSRRLGLAVVASTVTAWTASGRAQPIPGIDVHWAAPPACSGVDDLRARVHRLLGAEPAASPRNDRLVVDCTVVWVSGRYRLSLNVRKSEEFAGATRVFDSESCESLAGAAAVTLALLARGNPRWDEAAPSPSSSSPVSSAAPPTSTAVAPATERESPATTPRKKTAPPTKTIPPGEDDPHPAGANGPTQTRWSAVLRGPVLAVDEGVLPSWAFGLGVGAGARVNRFEVSLTGVLWLPQSDGAADVGPYAGRYERRSGELSSCYEWPLGKLELGPCVTVAIEDVTATGTGPNVVGRQGHIGWMTVGLAARARWSPRPWTALFIRPSVAVDTSRPTFAIDQVGSLYQTKLVAVGMDLGCEWIL